jgi:hypothetical protein
MASAKKDAMVFLYDTRKNKETPEFCTTNKNSILQTLVRESIKDYSVYEYHYLPEENCFLPKGEYYVAAYQYIDGGIRVLRK